MASDLTFDGTFHIYHSRTEYLDDLRNDPLEQCGYNLLSLTENEDSAAVFYKYEKLDRSILIAQLFMIEAQKIQKALLIFDGREFTHSKSLED